MWLALDSYYKDDMCNTSLVVYESLYAANHVYADTIYTKTPAKYESGRFYKRELPGILAILEKFRTEHPELWKQIYAIIVDSFVYLATKEDVWDGLGARLHLHLYAQGYMIPVIGVAKNNFGLCDQMRQTAVVYRRNSKRPLYVQTIGLPPNSFYAATWLNAMHGEYRIPTMLRDVDQLSRIFGTVAKLM